MNFSLFFRSFGNSLGNCMADKDYLKCINRAPKPVMLCLIIQSREVLHRNDNYCGFFIIRLISIFMDSRVQLNHKIKSSANDKLSWDLCRLPKTTELNIKEHATFPSFMQINESTVSVIWPWSHEMIYYKPFY